MNSALHAYRRSTNTQWTRIDLLVALYRATERTLAAGAAAIERQDLPEIGRQSLKVQRQILGIIEGIDDTDPTAASIKSLLIYCLSCVASQSTEQWRDAARLVGELRSAFEGIEEAGRELERRGEIAPLDFNSGRAIVA